ncbi:MAG: phosphotransferase [Desulfobacterales bacterium]|nr:phosphotransferase [Desulfobacterales bacterium]
MNTEAKLTPVREAHRFNEAALAKYLIAELDGFCEPFSILQFEGGQSNPTFLLDCGAHQFVLRKKPPGKLLPSAHQVDREFRVMKALEQSDVPVPRMNLLCEDETVIGTTFFVMEYVEGRLFSNVTLPGLSPGERRAIYFEMIRVLAALHSVDYEALGLSDFGKPGNYFARQIGRWSKQYVSAKTDHIPSMENLMNYLPQNVPTDDTTCIAHGDYRLENMLFHPTEPKILALLDWELSTLGHPLGDLAYSCGAYHYNMPGNPSLVGICGAKTGIPTESEFVEEYCRRIGREGIPNWNFYMAFAFFRLASILQGVYKRGLMGTASSTRALERGSLTRSISDLAWSFIKNGS